MEHKPWHDDPFPVGGAIRHLKRLDENEAIAAAAEAAQTWTEAEHHVRQYAALVGVLPEHRHRLRKLLNHIADNGSYLTVSLAIRAVLEG